MFCTVHGRFHCTVAALKIGLVLARGSCDIYLTQRLAFNRSSGRFRSSSAVSFGSGSDDIFLEPFLCSQSLF